MKRVLVFIISMFIASFAFAGPGLGRIAQKLNLNGTQKTQWRELQKSFRENNKDFLDQARLTMQQFRAAREAKDTAKVESLKPVVESTRAQMHQLHEEQEQKLMAILTEEQRTQFQELKSERQQHRRRQ